MNDINQKNKNKQNILTNNNNSNCKDDNLSIKMLKNKQDKDNSHQVLFSPDKIILEWKKVCYFYQVHIFFMRFL